MARFYVPYAGEKPAAVVVNGHRLVILSKEKETLEDCLGEMGADSLKIIDAPESAVEQELVFGKLAGSINSGVVVASGGLGVSDVIENLSTQLPWLH